MILPKEITLSHGIEANPVFQLRKGRYSRFQFFYFRYYIANVGFTTLKLLLREWPDFAI